MSTKKTKAKASVGGLDAFHSRNDGYANILTGTGTRADPTVMNTFRPEPRLDPTMLEAIFESDGVGRRIVEMPAEDMTREWLTIAGEEGEAVLDVMEEIGAAEAVTEGATWARLYGGAVALFDLDDGLDHQDPINPARIRGVTGMQIYDRWAVSIPAGMASFATAKDPRRRLAGISEYYTLQPHGGGMGFTVHESRLAFFPGKRIPLRQRRENLGWDDSVLQAVYAALTRYGMGLRYSENILRDFVQAVLAVNGLTSMIASGNEEVVRKRLELLDLSRSIINSMVIDAEGETYSKSSSTVSGLADILDRFAEHLATVTGIPVTKLFGRSAAGLNATGENDMRGYYDMLRGEQRRTLNPAVNMLVKLIYLSADGPTGGKEPEAWSIRWNSFYQPTEKETAETRKIVAETDAIYLDGGVLSQNEVAQSRFGQGAWSAETLLIEGTERDENAKEPPPVLGSGIDPKTGLPLDPEADPEAEDDAEE